ncbi:tRNA lysidine(34) synthetase TilS [Melioribacteraceae bacterium 4301-Me]|uniref:tRNA lysidine(34) synthetase TilS n=1 Tax=Pyranulibacter aquaticus TaxID=3163344 RepID=UPI0035973B6D
MKSIEQKVLKFIDDNCLIEKGDSILIALSGGPDSIFSLFFLNKYKKKFNVKLAAFHVNHKLRGKEADNDEEFCKKICSDLSIQFSSVKVNVRAYAKKNKISVEQAARKLRYDSLQKYADKHGFNKILTAHNLDDNAETILLNLFSGTGINGIAGIPIKRENIIRPVLCLSKKEIIQYLDKHKINYRIDSTNITDDYKRNFIRNNIVPLIKSKINSSFESALFRSSKIVEENLKLFETLVQRIIDKFIVIKKNEISIYLKILDEIDKEHLGQILKKIFTEKLKIEFSYKVHVALISLIEKQTGKKINLSNNYIALRERDKILIYKNQEKDKQQQILKIGQSVNFNGKEIHLEETKNFNGDFSSNGKVEFISGDKIEENFVLRCWKAGDKFIPLGMKNLKKVSDFLNEQKIPAKEKKTWPVLVNRNNIVWVVGLRIDDRYKIDSKTKKIIKLWTA